MRWFPSSSKYLFLRPNFTKIIRHFSLGVTSPKSRVALVTGASRGIGKHIALQLGEMGCIVVVNYFSNELAALEVCDMIKANGGIGIAMKANVGEHDQVKEMIQSITKDIGPIDILVNNAGITRDKLSVSMSPDDFAEVLKISLNGTFYCTQSAFKESMMSRRTGRIINIASIVGQIGNNGQANYSAAKAGVIGLTKTFAKEFGSRGVCVNAVCPGYIESDMTKNLDMDKILPNIPLRRLGKPEEVAGLVAFLALDPAAAYMTGHCINIDGGIGIGAT